MYYYYTTKMLSARYFPVANSPVPPEPTTVDISVTVTDGENAVQGAIVTIGGKSCPSGTGSSGGCTVSGVEIGEDVAVSATCDGYEDYTDTITVTEETSTLSITLTAVTPVYDVVITVDDGTNPVEGASVVIGETTKTTDASGECTFDDLEADTYSVEVSKEGYTTATESITVTSDDTTFTISLTESQQVTPEAP